MFPLKTLNPRPMSSAEALIRGFGQSKWSLLSMPRESPETLTVAPYVEDQADLVSKYVYSQILNPNSNPGKRYKNPRTGTNHYTLGTAPPQ